jgi:hypothetical protein
VKQVIEYGACFPEVLDEGSKMITRGPIKKGEAEGLVRYVNARSRERGVPERAYVVERVVQYGEWEPEGSLEAEAMRGGITL